MCVCDCGCLVILLPWRAPVSGAGQVIASEALNGMNNEKGEEVRGGWYQPESDRGEATEEICFGCEPLVHL